MRSDNSLDIVEDLWRWLCSSVFTDSVFGVFEGAISDLEGGVLGYVLNVFLQSPICFVAGAVWRTIFQVWRTMLRTLNNSPRQKHHLLPKST